jgi:hypothetical protein
MCLKNSLNVLHKSPQSLLGLHLPDCKQYAAIGNLSPNASRKPLVFIVSYHPSICATAPTNENSINDNPVETEIPPPSKAVPLLIEQIHDAVELVPSASTWPALVMNNRAV